MPRTEVNTGLPEVAPIAWATTAAGHLWTAQVPIRDDKTFETGDITDQARLTFDNLRRTLEAAGGTLADVVQVIIHLTDVGEAAAISGVWTEFFQPPYPNRAVIGTPALAIPGIRIELTATAVLP
jgi:enamine deaminase RidA (YjgF/YER057c/UK114 family)